MNRSVKDAALPAHCLSSKKKRGNFYPAAQMNSEWNESAGFLFCLVFVAGFFFRSEANRVNSGCVFFMLELEKQHQQRVQIKSLEKKRVTDEQQLSLKNSLFFCAAAENQPSSDWTVGRAA